MRALISLVCLFFLSLPVFSQKLVLDNSFTPNVNGTVSFLEIQSDGKILIAGDFTTINDVPAFKLARLNTDGTLDTSFNANWLPGPFNQGVGIQTMKLLPDGKILLGGGLPYNGSSGPVRLFRLNANGSFDNTLTTIPTVDNENGSFEEIAKADQLPNGKILVCGYFTKANNNPKVSLARFNNDGSFDSTFATDIDDITRTTDRCRDVAAQADGKYLVAGQFDTINGNPANGLTRFNADDSIDSTFTAATIPNTTSTQSLFIKPLADGSYFAVVATRVVRLNADGSLRLSLSSNGVDLNDIALLANGKTLATYSENFSRYNTDGTGDLSLVNISFSGPGHPDYPHAAKIAADGKIVVAGPFTSIWTSATGGINRSRIARFTQEAIPIKPKFDFDGDGRDDLAVYRPGEKIWYVNRSTDGFTSAQFGLSTDIPVVADYDGDGKADIAVWRPEGGVWYWLKSTDFTLGYAIVGQPGDIPQQRNANGAGSKMVFRPSDARWWVFGGFNAPSSIRMGVEQSGDIPVRDDYDGDGFSNLAVYRSGTWFYQWGNGGSVNQYQWGLAGDIPVQADYDGDLRSDFAVFRPSTGVWYIKKTNEGFYAVQWGVSGDIPVPGDYDGDGKTDIAIYRPSTGIWYIMKSTGSYHIEHFGLTGDIPAQMR